MLLGQRSVQSNIDHAKPGLRQRIDGLLNRFCAGAHQDDDTLCLWIAVIVEQFVLATRTPSKTVHLALHDPWRRVIETINTLAPLKIDVRILRCSTNKRVIRVQRTISVFVDEIGIHHFFDRRFGHKVDLADFVRGSKTIKKVCERNA